MHITRLRRAAAAAAGLAALAVASGASAATVEKPTFAKQQVWFNCDGQQTKVVNANNAALSGKVPGWDTSAPTQSVQAGAGCGTADPSLLIATVEDTSVADATWSGTYVGNLDAITVEAYDIYVGSARGGVTQFGVTPRLFVDGAAVALTPANIIVQPAPTSTGAAEKIAFTITGLGLTEDLDEDGVADPGPGTLSRKITVQLQSQYFNSTFVSAWVWDTTEVPGGLVFNPTTREAATVAAQGEE